MINNAGIRIESQMNNLGKLMDKIREMTDEQITEMEKELKDKTKVVSDKIYLVSLLSGREIGDKAYKRAVDSMTEQIKNGESPELKEAIEDGYIFDSRAIPAIDAKTGKPTMRTVWSDNNAAACREAVKGAIPDELYEEIDNRLNKYEMRREHGMAKRDSLNSVKHAINTIKRERKDKVHAIKKVKLIPLSILGKQLMESMQVQPVRQITA